MLTKLNIKNFALIDDLSIDFKNGFVVFSGETGSGKSILINSLSFLIGERADKTFVRFGKPFALVEGVFNVDAKTKSLCESMGIEVDASLVLSRKLTADGKSDVRANGNLLSVSMLKKITTNLVDIYGQHQHQCLLDEASHINFVDAFDVPKELEELKLVCEKLAQTNKKLGVFGQDEGFLARQKDILQFELAEINEATPSIDEELELLEKKKKFSNVQRVAECVDGAKSAFGFEDFSVENSISSALKVLKSVANVDSQIEEVCGRLESLKIEFEDVDETLSSILESYDFSTEEFANMEQRLEVFSKLKRKYGGSMESVIAYMEKVKEDLTQLENSEQEIEKLTKEKHDLIEKGEKLSEIVSQKRKQNAKIVEEQVVRELAGLGMKDSHFEIEFSKASNFGENGFDVVRFLFSANAGQPLKPLSKVISGGEMSRFMLAFKVVFGGKTGVSTMIFDEIDSGIGGETGVAVGLKLLQLAKTSQVFAVTHLASVGAMADQHFQIQKQISNGQTFTTLTELEGEAQIDEIARLAGGFKGQLASEYAKQLKKRAIQVKS